MTCAEIAEQGLIERYVAGMTSADEAAALEAHYIACAYCQTELRLAVALRRELRAPAGRSRRRWPLLIAGASLALAAGLATLVVIPRSAHRFPEPGSGLGVRGGGEAGLPVLRSIAPAPGASVPRDSVKFIWHRIGPDAAYRLTLTTDSGDVVWSGTIADTTGTIPRGTRLRSGAYAWFVDAMLPDGRSVTSGVQMFRTTP